MSSVYTAFVLPSGDEITAEGVLPMRAGDRVVVDGIGYGVKADAVPHVNTHPGARVSVGVLVELVAAPAPGSTYTAELER